LSPARRQRGAAAALILVVIVILMVIALAAAMISRLRDLTGEVATATGRLETAQAALEAYAAASARLPCPADPTLDAAAETGVEVPNGVDCTFPEGTLPWKTIGLRRDDAIDPWGRKLSYRVYAGATGFTQPGGVSMVACDTEEASPGGTVAGGLCNADANLMLRNTTPAQFVAGKGLRLTDMANPQYTDVAYVILSHGESGLGGYSISGARLEMPKGDQLKNTEDDGPFTIKAHSDYDTEATHAQHFDDILVYRRIEDLAKRIGLAARDWFDSGTSSLVFSQANVSAAVGSSVSPGSTGQSTLNFASASGDVRVSGRTGASTPTEITFGLSGANEGVGVAGGGSDMMQSAANESLRIDLERGARRFGVTLANFGYYGASPHFELVQFDFYLDDAPVGNAVYRYGCYADGGIVSVDVPVSAAAPTGAGAPAGAVFNRVDITPIPAAQWPSLALNGNSAFLVSEIKACEDAAAACVTSLSLPANQCPPPPT
jgi:hypothetical protein